MECCSRSYTEGWKLADSTIATTGVIGIYEPAGEIKKGSFAE